MFEVVDAHTGLPLQYRTTLPSHCGINSALFGDGQEDPVESIAIVIGLSYTTALPSTWNTNIYTPSPETILSSWYNVVPQGTEVS